MYTEGKARIKYTKDSFLNEHGRIPRDISVAFASQVANRKSSIIDTTSATGIRGIRYYLETPSKDITFLEINKKAFGSLKKNISSNKIKAKALNQSIQEFANTMGEKFDMIDLDPFGGISPYVYDLMKISKGGTYFMATATDMAVLCGADFKACIKLYDARPMHNEMCKEVALRILVGCIARNAAQFNFGVDVLLSFSYMHYMRVFVRLEHGSSNAMDSVKKLGYAYYCSKCGYRSVAASFYPSIRACECCGGALETAGKLWCGKVQARHMLESMMDHMTLDYRQNSRGPYAYNNDSVHFLRAIASEIDVPLYYSIPHLSRRLGIGSVSDKILMERLKKKGFLASGTHMEKSSVKTNADLETIKTEMKKIWKGY